MSILFGQSTTADIKFLQLKSFQLTSQNDSGSGQCLAIDQNQQIVFVCCQNELILVPLSSLLNFDNWSQDILKKVDTNLQNKFVVKIAQNPINSHLVSISSKGFGTKLAVCCYDPGSVCLSIKFYNLQSLYNEKQNCAPYNQFIVPLSSNGETLVRMLSWHPEISNNIFACSLTDGSLYIVYVSDCDRQVITVLASLPNSRNVSAFSWSPKGKQLVIGFKDSRFSQFKFQINEKNLVQNIPFDEVKKINLPDDFKAYEVSNICWLSTFNFIVICYNPQENDSRYLIVSIPSAKATGPDAVMKIVDFSCINLDLVDNRKLFEVNLLQLENLVFTYTNRSYQFALLGCPTTADIVSYQKWSEVTFEDTENLLIPYWGTELPLACGFAFTKGTSKCFNFGSMSKGGPTRPFALTYSKFGQVTVFLSDFQNPQNETFLKVPTAPHNVIKPTVPASLSSTEMSQPKPEPALSFNTLTNNQPKMPAQSFNPIATSSLSNLNQSPLGFSAASNTSIANTSQTNSAFSLSSNLTKQQSPKSDSIPTMSEPTSNKPISQPKEDSSLTETKLENKLLIEEICSNIAEFNAEIRSTISSQKAILSSLSIGTSDEFEKIKCDSEFVKQMLNEITESFGTLNVDVNDLQASFIELHYLLEETRTMLDRNTDPKYRDILRQRNLDPITVRKVKDIHSLTDYIDVQLREIDNKFDQEWHQWLQNKRKSKLNPYSPRKYTAPTSPFQSFIGGHQRTVATQNGDKDNICSIKTLYQAIANNQRLITNLKLQINEKIAKNVPVKQDFKRFSEFPSQDNVNNLTNSLGKVSLSGNGLKNTPYKSNSGSVLVQCLPTKQKTALKSFLENRRSVPIRTCGTCLLDDEFTKKSRFMSALEKIKLKDTEKLLPKSNNLLPSQTNIKSTQQPNRSQVTVSKPTETKIAPVSKLSFVSSSTSKASTPVSLSSGMSILQSKLTTTKPQPSLAIQTTKSESIPSVTVKLPIPKSRPQTAAVSTTASISKPIFEDISPASTPNKSENESTNLSVFSNASSNASFFELTTNSAFSFLPVSSSIASATVPATIAITSASKQILPATTKSTTSSFMTMGSSSVGSNFSFNLGSSSPFNFGNQAKLSTLSTPSSVSTSVNAAPTLTLVSQAAATSAPTTVTSSKTLLSVGLPSFSTSLFSTSNSSSTSTVVTPSPSFSFAKSISNLSNSNQVKTNSETIPSTATTDATTFSPIVSSSGGGGVETVKSSTNQQTSTVSKSEPITTSLFTTPISSASGPSFSTSLFGSASVSSAPLSTPSVSNTSVASISAAPTSASSKPFEFSFNSALSGLALKTSEPADVGVTTSVPISTTSSFFGTNSTSAFSFGQPQSQNSASNAVSSSTTSAFSFASPGSFSALENSLNKTNICSPNTNQSTSSVFGSFSFGGSAATSLNSSATSPFGSLQQQTTSSLLPATLSAATTTNSFFASSSSSAWPSFGSQNQNTFGSVSNSAGSFGNTSSPISKQGFAVTTSASAAASPAFGSSQAFGGSPVFGGQSPTVFGGAPTFGSVSPPVFGGNAFGNQAAGSPSFSNLNTSPIFGNFALNDNSAPTFDSLAADVNDSKPFASPVAASFGDAFTQRRK